PLRGYAHNRRFTVRFFAVMRITAKVPAVAATLPCATANVALRNEDVTDPQRQPAIMPHTIGPLLTPVGGINFFMEATGGHRHPAAPAAS
ncbi:MAG: hypothetical protein M3381_10520, partial [Actinomycetota bacterium]|nr:hypothetical protein [Actinomycetota bacterium]